MALQLRESPAAAVQARVRVGAGIALAVLAVVAALGIGGLGSLLEPGPAAGAPIDRPPIRLATAACPGPRPPVRVTVSRAAPDTLGVSVTAGAGNLQSILFGPAANAAIDVPGQPTSTTGGFEVTYPGGVQSTTFTVRQGPANAAATVPLTVRDECGDWPTFVGGGVNTWPTAAASQTATLTPTPMATATVTATATTVPTATGTTVPPGGAPVREGFEGQPAGWQVAVDATGSGSVQRSAAVAPAEGSYAARAATTNGGRAGLRLNFQNAAASHTWEERPGDWYWQRASVYVPSATVSALGSNSYLTLGRLWASGSNYGWSLRVRQNGELYVVGQRDWDNAPFEYRIYGQVPRDRWFELELGLHSQAGPGVKRAFAFLIDGAFYGWYHQGRMQDETYDQAAIGVVETNSSSPLEVFVDRWRSPTAAALPDGLDNRSTADVQEQDYRTQSGEQWQIDWTTWANDLRLAPVHGLYSASDRLQSGRNLDRMPDLTSGWAEIEIGWPNGTPPDRSPSDGSYFGPMVGFRKEINREQNLEVIPIGRGGGNVSLAFEVWNGSGPTILAEWPLPLASIGGGSHIPEPGDVIRARWDQVSASQLRVRASYYDASAAQWFSDVVDHTFDASNQAGVNFNDGYHTASSVTIDSPAYSIRRFRLGVPSTYPGP